MRYKATIDIYIDMDERWTDAEGALADGISDMMELAQAQTHEANDGFVLTDWSYHPPKPFDGPTPAEQMQP